MIGLAVAVSLVAGSLMECVDDGPWPCSVEGCPAPSLDCVALAELGFCGLGFEEVWKPPPVGNAGRIVSSGCPRACGRCGVPAPDECNMDALDARSLSAAALAEALGQADTPRIVRGWGPGGADGEAVYESLLREHGGTRVQVVIEGGARRGEATAEAEMAWADYPAAVRSGAVPEGAYIFFDVNSTALPAALPAEVSLFACAMAARAAADASGLPSDATASRLLLSAGGWANGRPFHAHGPALLRLLSGVKRWFVRRPNATFEWQALEIERSSLRTPLDAGWEDQLWVCAQRSGELVYVPDGLQHATLNHAASTVGLTVVVDELAPMPLHEAARNGAAAQVASLCQTLLPSPPVAEW